MAETTEGPKGAELDKAVAAAGIANADELTADEKRAALQDAGYNQAALDQAKKDAEWIRENDRALVREANPDVGGEGFSYPR